MSRVLGLSTAKTVNFIVRLGSRRQRFAEPTRFIKKRQTVTSRRRGGDEARLALKMYQD
jgi:hypothetical protein